MTHVWLDDISPDIYFSNNYIVLDFETTNIDKGSALVDENRLLLTAYCGADGDIKTIWGGTLDLAELVDLCEHADFIVAHNAKFELQWLHRCGLDLTKVLVFDTMIAEKVLLGNRKKPLDADSVAQRWNVGGKQSLVSLLIKEGVCPSLVPESWLERYCATDVRITYAIFREQLHELAERDLLPVMMTRCILTPVLADIERNGMFLDRERVTEEYTEFMQMAAGVQEQLDNITGGINPRSPPQVAEFLYGELGFKELRDRRGNYLRGKPTKRFPEGAPKTDKDTILALKPTTKRQKLFIRLKQEQSKLDAAISKTLRPAYLCVTEGTGVLFGQFNQTVADTHRLSSSGKKYGMQFQNFPRKFKKLFTARKEGWRICEGDGAQLEFRVGAFLGQDEQAITDIVTGVDIHQFTADTLTSAGEATSRQDAKASTFRPLYGGSSGSPAIKAYCKAFREKYVGIATTQEKWKTEVLSTKSLKTCTGLRFYWPDTKMSRSGYISNSTQICNYPVQMFATADIIPVAVTYLWHRMHDAKVESFMVNTIHDSCILEEKEEEEQIITELFEISFVKDVYSYLRRVYNIDFNVPLEVEVEHKQYWGK